MFADKAASFVQSPHVQGLSELARSARGHAGGRSSSLSVQRGPVTLPISVPHMLSHVLPPFEVTVQCTKPPLSLAEAG